MHETAQPRHGLPSGSLSASSAKEKYTLLRAAVCEHYWLVERARDCNLSAYVQTPEGLFSLPALVLHCNKFTNCDPEFSAQVVDCSVRSEDIED